MTIFFGRESAEEKNVVVRFETPFRDLRRRHSLADHGPVGHVGSMDAVCGPIVLLQSLGHNHRAVRQPRRGNFSEAKSEGRKTSPLFSLPILALNCDYCLFSYQTWKERKQRGTLGMVVHDVASAEHYMDCAQPGVHERL